MRFLSLIIFGPVLLLVVLSVPAAVSAKTPAGLMNCDERNQARCDSFWNRQSPTQKKFLLSFPVGERNAALTCFALHGYGKITKKLYDCTRALVGDRKSMSYCEKKGHELMSEAMAKCQNKYRRANNYPLPY